MNNLSLSFPEFKLPQVHVDDISQLSLFEQASYIPGLSTIKGAGEVLVGCAMAVHGVASVLFGLPIVVVFGFPGALLLNTAGKPPLELLGDLARLFCYQLTEDLAKSCALIGRGLIESVPVLGNLTIAYLDGRIRIINT